MGYKPWLSVIGLYNYEPTIFDKINLPTGVDRETFMLELLQEAGEFPLVYTNPDLLATLFPAWSSAQSYKWATLQKTTTLDYNPIENYNRTETWTEKRNGSSDESHSGSDSGTTSAEGFTDVAAFNSTELAPQDSTRTTGESTTNFGHKIATTDSDSSTHEGHISGNIGVTTSQQMLEQERIVANFSIYKVIVDDFINNFCVMVY